MFSSPTPDDAETAPNTILDDGAIGCFGRNIEAANNEENGGEEEDAFAIDRAATGGVHWSKAETSFLRFKGPTSRTRIFTLPDFPPGAERASFPITLPELGIRNSQPGERDAFKSELLSTYDAAIAREDWPYALRCAIVAEMIRRTARIHAARGERALYEFAAHGGVYHHDAQGDHLFLPAPPVELKPIFHGIDYGASPRELAFMHAVGVRPVQGRVAGFEAVAPLHVVLRTRNIVSKRLVNIPAVVAKASISEADNATPADVLARRCRALVASCEGLDADPGATSPLCLLELQVLACIPSGRIHLSPAAAPHYEHLFGTRNDTRRFWLTSYDTDRLQYPCAIVDGSVFSPLAADVPPVEPARLAVMASRRAEAAFEERAMFQVMLGVWGIDRMTVGRRFEWREAAGAGDDLTWVDQVGVYPQWLPAATEAAAAEEEEDALAAYFSALDALDELPTRKRKRTPFRRADDEPPARNRAPRGSGRIVIQYQPILEWAKASLAAGVVQGGSCASVCVQDLPGVQPRWRYTVTPGIVVGIVDAVISEAVASMSEARVTAGLFASCLHRPSSPSPVDAYTEPYADMTVVDADSTYSEPPLVDADLTVYPASEFAWHCDADTQEPFIVGCTAAGEDAAPQCACAEPPPAASISSSASASTAAFSSSDEEEAEAGLFSDDFLLREQCAEDDALIWDEFLHGE